MFSDYLQDVSIESWVGELGGSVVMIYEIHPTRSGLPLFPSVRQGSQRFRCDILRVKVSRYPGIMPGGHFGWNMVEIDLSLLGGAHFITRRKINCRSYHRGTPTDLRWRHYR